MNGRAVAVAAPHAHLAVPDAWKRRSLLLLFAFLGFWGDQRTSRLHFRSWLGPLRGAQWRDGALILDYSNVWRKGSE